MPICIPYFRSIPFTYSKRRACIMSAYSLQTWAQETTSRQFVQERPCSAHERGAACNAYHHVKEDTNEILRRLENIRNDLICISDSAPHTTSSNSHNTLLILCECTYKDRQLLYHTGVSIRTRTSPQCPSNHSKVVFAETVRGHGLGLSILPQ